jgi:hypothetical protein
VSRKGRREEGTWICQCGVSQRQRADTQLAYRQTQKGKTSTGRIIKKDLLPKEDEKKGTEKKEGKTREKANT